jgi:CheY-like chemotaxis protein
MESPKSILVVDDSRVLRELMRILLEGSGYAVACAANGQEALDHLLRADTPDVIVLDLLMPVMDGWVFRGHQRCLPGLDSIPVILLSVERNLAEHAFALGAARYLRKPFDPADLLAAIESLMVAGASLS